MRVTRYSIILMLAFFVFFILVMAGCRRVADVDGDNTGGVADTGSDTGSDTDTDADSDTDSDDTTVVVPRPPAHHRPEALSCVGVHSPPEPADIWDTEYSECTRHADCVEGDNGKCISGIGMMGGTYFCTYDQCATDDECDPGKICYCTPSTAAGCLTIGNCQIDADCGKDNYCSPSMSWDCGGYRPIDGYHCHTASDTCVDDADCTGSDYCNLNIYENRWECTAVDDTCVIG